MSARGEVPWWVYADREGLADKTTGKIVLRCTSLADGTPGPAGQYLETYDPETGFSTWTYDLDKAIVFETVALAYRFWMQVKENEPLRAWDGKPNRPLTAFTVEIGPPNDHPA